MRPVITDRVVWSVGLSQLLAVQKRDAIWVED